MLAWAFFCIYTLYSSINNPSEICGYSCKRCLISLRLAAFLGVAQNYPKSLPLLIIVAVGI